jgi:tetratricopeptide (TPR) repeat protein
MKWKVAGWVALGALLAWAAVAGAQGAQENQQKSDTEKERAIKEKNEKAKASNKLIPQANAALLNKQWQEAEDLLKKLIEINPEVWNYRQGMGTAQMNLGQYEDALKSFDMGINLAQKELESKPPDADAVNAKPGIAMMLTFEGNAYLKLKKNDLAIAAYTKAAAMDANPALAYFNLCATQYNTGNMTDAVAACDKAIVADPTKADAYFIKASALYGDGKLDAKGIYILPPGTLEALKKYLELAPTGGHMDDVKAMLEAAGVKL